MKAKSRIQHYLDVRKKTARAGWTIQPKKGGGYRRNKKASNED